MEKSKRNVLLLIALIVGVCVLGLLCWGIYTNTYASIILFYYDENRDVAIEFAEKPLKEVIEDPILKADALKFWKENHGAWKTITENGFNIWFAICMPILFVAALVLNIFAWLKNGAKRTLAAAILYLVGLNIPSAILCFIGFSKLKKAKAG